MRLWQTSLALMAFVAVAQDVNINSRYKVEKVDLVPPRQAQLSRTLRNDLKKLVGHHLNQKIVDSIRDRLQAETNAKLVVQRLAKGSSPDAVRVVFEIKRKDPDFDIDVPKLTYYATQGWSGGGDGVLETKGNRFSLGFINDGDVLLERFAGIRGSYERRDIAGRFGVRFDIQDYRAQWNSATLNALGSEGVAGTPTLPGIYRQRRVFQPVFTVQLLRSLAYSAGASVENLEMQFPAARTEAANAVIQTLRFHRRWQLSEWRQNLDAGYHLRAATRSLASDFVYNRHTWDAQYRLRRGRHEVSVAFQAGVLGGRAPFFERFVLGNSSILRGWNKFDETPIGASRVAAGTVEYVCGVVRTFYDAGSAWNPGDPAPVRHSLGVGVRAGKKGPYLSVAFPVRDGFNPVFMTSLAF